MTIPPAKSRTPSLASQLQNSPFMSTKMCKISGNLKRTKSLPIDLPAPMRQRIVYKGIKQKRYENGQSIYGYNHDKDAQTRKGRTVTNIANALNCIRSAHAYTPTTPQTYCSIHPWILQSLNSAFTYTSHDHRCL